MDSELGSLLKEIPASEVGGAAGLTFTALPIPGFEPHRLARSVTGEPALLIAVSNPGDRGFRPTPIQLEHVGVTHEVTCRIRNGEGQTQELPFTVIQFSGDDPYLRSYFLQVSWSLLESVGQAPTADEVHNAVNSLVELFRSLTRPSNKSVQGLWAEIFVIALASDPVALAGCWHTSPEDRYDFHGGEHRVEVKSTSGRVRRHRFSFEQLQPPKGTKLIIASVMLEPSRGGVSLREAIDKVHQRLKHAYELQGHLDRVVAQTLGESLPRALDARFDWELARDTLAFFEYSAVPSIPGPLPPAVSEVSFLADLSSINHVYASAMTEGLFGAARPLIQR